MGGRRFISVSNLNIYTDIINTDIIYTDIINTDIINTDIINTDIIWWATIKLHLQMTTLDPGNLKKCFQLLSCCELIKKEKDVLMQQTSLGGRPVINVSNHNCTSLVRGTSFDQNGI